MQIKDITVYLEQWAPLAYQESYDNSGLLVGNAFTEVTGILICLDVTEDVLEEAKLQHCNLIIAHHPIIFQPIKKLTGANTTEKCIIKAIKYNMAIYALHTNLDNILQGVNQQMAQQLGLINCKILLPKSHTLQKLTIQCASIQQAYIREALQKVVLGNVKDDHPYCFASRQHAIAGDQASQRGRPPSISTPLYQLEMLFPVHLRETVLTLMKQFDAQEVHSYYVQDVASKTPHVGAGIIGELPHVMSNHEFLMYLKAAMNLMSIRHSLPLQKPIKHVALCGGSGSFLQPDAIGRGADVLVTSDVKYHDFLLVAGKLLLVDIGHYESEVAIKELIYNKLSEKFSNIVLLKSTTQTNPVYYA
eukprot:gene86-113_t